MQSLLKLTLGIGVTTAIALLPQATWALNLKAGQTYTQDFNDLSASGSDNDITTQLDGWFTAEISGNGLYRAGTGSIGTGDTYSYGIDTSDRALGSLASGSRQPRYGVKFDIVDATPIGQLALAFQTEQWRKHNSPDERVDFQYKIASSAISNTNAWLLDESNWLNLDALDLQPINAAVGNGQTDGNSAIYRSLRQASISGLNLAAGDTLLLRWVDSDSTGRDYGLAIDDFSITANTASNTAAVPTPALLPGLLGFGLRILRRRQQH